MDKIIERDSDSHIIFEIDKTVKNKFRWEWLEKTVQVPLSKGKAKHIAITEWIRKMDIPGKAKCITCRKLISYGSRGCISLVEHCESTQHLKIVKDVATNQSLPGATIRQAQGTYGIHPMFLKGQSIQQPQTTKPAISLDDRIANSEVRNYCIVNII